MSETPRAVLGSPQEPLASGGHSTAEPDAQVSAAPLPHATTQLAGTQPAVTFLGSAAALDRCAPSAGQLGFSHRQLALKPREDAGELFAQARELRCDLMVVLDPPTFPADALAQLPCITVGVLLDAPPSAGEQARSCATLDRVVTFDPALTGRTVGGLEIWRAIPPPVSDAFFNACKPPNRAPRAISLGRSTDYREWFLMPAKHHHDLMQAIHGLGGPLLAEVLAEYDVGVHVGRGSGGEFGWQAALHLAAGHLLLSEPLRPAHGLEADIDYMQFKSPEDLLVMLDRLASFPEMHRRTQIRGRLKAEHFRASRVFARLVHDALLDVGAFGGRRAAAP
ncbi:MAG: hypothetical protein WB698_14080 [Solirubrobacteraceae bacterium]